MNSRSVIYKCFISHDRFALFCFVSLRNRIASHRIESHRLVSIRSASHLFALYRIVLNCIALLFFTLHRFASLRIAFIHCLFPTLSLSLSLSLFLSFCFCLSLFDRFSFFRRHCAMPRILWLALASSWLHSGWSQAEAGGEGQHSRQLQLVTTRLADREGARETERESI